MPENFGVPNDEQLAKINKFAKRKLSAEEIFVYAHKMAGDMIIPERHTQLSIALLEQFVQNANAGVAFLLDHSWSGFGRPKAALPYGRVFEGQLSQNGLIEGETISFNGTTYIVRGQEKDNISTDSIISDIETGVIFDTSIGWGASKFECSVCGNDVRDWRKCDHIPGVRYVVDQETGESKLCWAIAKTPGYLMEDSAVFDGAYPGAGASLSSASDDGFENEHGSFLTFDDYKEIPLDCTVYGTYSNKGGILTFVKKSDHNKHYGLSNTSNIILKGGEKPMNEKLSKMFETFGITFKEGETKLDDVLSQLAEKWDTTIQDVKDSFVKDAELSATVEYMTKEQVSEKFGKEYSSDEVLKLAKEGMEYHSQVVNDAIAMGIRAMGNDFPSETWKNTFDTMSTQSIKDITSTWDAQAKTVIPAGRVTDPTLSKDIQKIEMPDEAFKVNK